MSFPKVKVRRSSIDGDTTDMVVLEVNVQDEVVPESFIDQRKQSSLHLEKSKNLEKVMKKIKSLQDEHKDANQVEVNPLLIQIQSSVLQRKNCIDSNVHSRTAVYLQPLRMIPPKFKVRLHPLAVPKAKTCFFLKTLPKKPLLPITSPVEISYKAGP